MFRFALSLTLLLACGGGTSTEANVAETKSPVVLTLPVYSGRENPPPETTNVRVGTEVTVRLEGLGPPRARVIAPDGTANVIGTEGRFTTNAPGQWRVELDGAPGVALAYVNAN